MKFRVVLKIEEAGKSEDDPQVEKFVEASSEEEALAKARKLVQVENPELNHLKIYFWAIWKLP